MILVSKNARTCNAPIHAGFTIVELVVTLVLIAVIAAIGVPVLMDRDAFDDRGFFEQTVAALRYAQKRANVSGCTVRVNIAANGYSLFTAASSAACDNTAACTAGNFGTVITSPVDPTQPFAGTAPGGVVLSPVTNICFRPAGVTTLAADTVVSVGGLSFTVVANTGFVSVQRP